MTGRTVILELHGWRGFHIDGGALGRVLIVGFVSVSYVPYLLTDWLKDRIGKLKGVAGSRAFVEMAAFDEEGPQQVKGSKVTNVPWNGKALHK